MLINLRNALMAGKRLPYDAEVEYLESTGTQWIDTGIISDGTGLTVEVTCSKTTSATQEMAIVGRSGSDGFDLYVLNSKFELWNSNGRVVKNPTTISAGEVYDVIGSTTGGTVNLSVNGVNSSHSSVISFPNRNIVLFRHNSKYYWVGRLMFCKIYVNGVLVRDFIPVRKGTVGYLYDRVSGKLFGNAGTGDFVLGPDVVPVEYIESHGTEYIDTGVLIEMTDRVDCTFELLAYGNATLAGGRVGPSTSSWAVWAYTSAEQRIRFDLWSDNHGGIATSIAPTLGQEYKVSKIGERNFVDGVEVQSNTSVAYTPSRPCYLFAMNNGGTASFIVNCRIKDFSIGSKLKYRPIRVGTDATSWEGAMMDVLTRRIYRNAGTGAFTFGNDLKYPIPAE